LRRAARGAILSGRRVARCSAVEERPVTAPARFSPGIIDYDDMAARYQAGRALSEEAARAWTTALAPFVRGAAAPTILDLGAGTGRFAARFAVSFDARVIGVEPSAGMLAAAVRQERPKNLIYVAGTAERIPLADASCDLAWMSQVWHHVRDHRACAKDLQRVVRPGGHVLVRATFGDRLDGFPTLFQFWPASRAICAQLPTLRETVDVFKASGFAVVEHRRVQQVTAGSLQEFATRTKFRADSALALISDAEFQEGQAAVERTAAAEASPAPVVEIIDLLVFHHMTSAHEPRS
jgi:ubiquinone/menaquinone biosynthesis C-methylase UbiE